VSKYIYRNYFTTYILPTNDCELFTIPRHPKNDIDTYTIYIYHMYIHLINHLSIIKDTTYSHIPIQQMDLPSKESLNPKPLLLQDYILASRLTQFVSIDLILLYPCLKRKRGCNPLISSKTKYKVLLGLRKNAPAKDTYFVPGGKVWKNELLSHAIHRIALNELGIKLDPSRIVRQGVYEHLYPNNYSDRSFGTHYVAFPIRYILTPDEYQTITTGSTFYDQHLDILWLTTNELLDHDLVNPYVKMYFLDEAPNRYI